MRGFNNIIIVVFLSLCVLSGNLILLENCNYDSIYRRVKNSTEHKQLSESLDRALHQGNLSSVPDPTGENTYNNIVQWIGVEYGDAWRVIGHMVSEAEVNNDWQTVKDLFGPGEAVLDSNIIRGYDIRGFTVPIEVGNETVAANLTPKVAELIGKVLGSRIGPGSTVVISGDMRDSTSGLIDALILGYISTGVNVQIDRSQVPSGGNNWYLITRNLDGAVQVTGSHNPAEYNGLKVSEGLSALFGEELTEIIPVIQSGEFREVDQIGTVTEVDVKDPYMQMLEAVFPEYTTPFRVVVDCGNGIGAPLIDVLRSKGVEVIGMYTEPDGTFPNHLADPSKIGALQDLIAKVKELNSSLEPGDIPWIGIALDGDADRSGFIDEEGNIVYPERMAAIFYRGYVRENPGAVMALDVRASNSTSDMVREEGGIGWFIKAGYPAHRAFVRVTGKEGNFNKPRLTGLSAEASGHFFFNTAGFDENGDPVPHAQKQGILTDDGLYAALKFLQILDNTEQDRLVDLIATVPTNPVSNEVRVTCPDDVKFDIVDQIEKIVRAEYAAQLNPTGEIITVGEDLIHGGLMIQSPTDGLITVDGVRAQFKDGSWFLIRASNTSPKLTLKFEALTQELLIQRLREVRDLLSQFANIELHELDAEIALQIEALEGE